MSNVFGKEGVPSFAEPEHNRRDSVDHASEGPLHPEISAAYDYVDSVLETSEFDTPYYLWCGWSMREAFLAGITYARRQPG
jgi:hypothetical protein